MKKLIVIDGHNLLFRMFFGMPNKIYDNQGNMIHGTIGFIGSILKIVKSEEPCYLCVVFDSEKKSDRFEDINYKKTRIQEFGEENNPFSQMDDIRCCLDLLKFVWIEKEGIEADDVIASIVKRAESLMDESIIVSTDKDFFQLINQKINVLVPRGKLSVRYDEEKILEKFSIYPFQYVDYCSLVGDKSDNIAGVKGIGKVTASKLLTQYNKIETVFENISKLTPNIRHKLDNQYDMVQHNKKLLSLYDNIDLSIDFDKMYISKVNYKTMDVVNQVVNREF